MKEKIIFITISPDSITYREESNSPQGNKLDKNDLDIRIIKIFHKVLNTALPGDTTQIFDSENFKTLGATLHKILLNFQNDNFNFSNIHNDIHKGKDVRCRIVLEFDKNVDGLAELPWEYLSHKDEFLFAYRETNFELIRKIQPTGIIQIPEYTDPSNHLNVILIIANPRVGNWNIDTKIVHQCFNDLKKKYGEKINVLYFPEQLDRKNFYKNFKEQLKSLRDSAQNSREPYIVHFYGHACIKDGKSCLVFPPSEENGNEPDFVSDEVFDNYFSGSADLPVLFILQACSSGKIMDYKNEQGIALRLSSRRSIPAVLSMQNDIKPTESTAFMKVFYEKLMEGHDVSSAVREGRTYMGNDYQLEQGNAPFKENFFGSPILMLTSPMPPVLIKKEEAPISNNQVNSASSSTVSMQKICINARRGNPGCKRPVAMEVSKCVWCQSTEFVPIDTPDTLQPLSTPTAEDRNISGERMTDNFRGEISGTETKSADASSQIRH